MSWGTMPSIDSPAAMRRRISVLLTGYRSEWTSVTEGGMAAEEIAALTEIGAQPVTLGRRILRAETAAVAAAAVTMALWGDL